MTENKLTEQEIMKALECCILGDCQGCYYGDTDQRHCKDDLMQNALDLINRKNAEIERARAEAIKEFAERVKMLNNTNLILWNEQIDQIAKEMGVE